MTTPREPLFLARQNYRRRRLSDAARLLPFLGGILFMQPLLAAGQGGNSTVGWVTYIFVVWLLLISIAAVLSRNLAKGRADADAPFGQGSEDVR